MRNVLFIILEIESASGLCIINDAVELKKRGWNVDIITCGTKDYSKNNAGINFYYINPKLFIHNQKRARGKYKKKFWENMYRLQVLFYSLVWPLNAPIFVCRLKKMVDSIIKNNSYDAVVPVYTQIDALLAVYWIKKKNSSFKAIAYFIDSLSAGPKPRLLSKRGKLNRGLKWEKQLCSIMDGIVYMESSRSHHEKFSKDFDYYERTVFLDIPAFVRRFVRDKEIEKKNNEKIIITYVGSMPLRIRNPEYAFRVLSSLQGVNVEIRVIGVSELEAKSINTYGLEVYWLGRKPHAEIEQFFVQSDVLLNIGNNIPSMVPSKVFEYISYKKPIVSFSPIENEPSSEYLRKYGYSCIINENEEFDRNVHMVNDFLKDLPMVKYSDEELEELFYYNTPKAFAEYLEGVCKKGTFLGEEVFKASR